MTQQKQKAELEGFLVDSEYFWNDLDLIEK